METVPGGPDPAVLAVFGLDRHRVTVLSDVPDGNANWLVTGEGGHRLVLRRHHGQATFKDLAWEYAVLRHLAGAGWNIPAPVGELTGHQGRWYGLTRYVPGQPVRPEGPAEQAERGQVLARLHLALRELGDRIGPRPGWRPPPTAPSWPGSAGRSARGKWAPSSRSTKPSGSGWRPGPWSRDAAPGSST